MSGEQPPSIPELPQSAKSAINHPLAPHDPLGLPQRSPHCPLRLPQPTWLPRESTLKNPNPEKSKNADASEKSKQRDPRSINPKNPNPRDRKPYHGPELKPNPKYLNPENPNTNNQ